MNTIEERESEDITLTKDISVFNDDASEYTLRDVSTSQII